MPTRSRRPPPLPNQPDKPCLNAKGRYLGKTNRHGTPFIALLVTAAFNMVLISTGSLAAILAAAAIGYTCANGISLFAYVRARKHPALAQLERPFKAPRGWKHVAMLFGLFNLPLCLVGVVYLNSLEIGWTSTWLGFIVLSLYIPIWLYSQHETRRRNNRELPTTIPSNSKPDDDAADLEKVPSL
ncbi:amino acid permease [Arthrobacter sp. QXT-31]|uniref:amino acid permease n=1 Tax=Arthrobacter sp. QXT-31 TaxID=1357915 RepID=UPI000971852D|nr:amino acid permease [Arthrobacter sp. QXT-31]APX02405.1 hypothetical protein BWQ92_12430 [Arthrobacter sp. QXT-31]